jgi:hypothetical protein
MHWFQALPSRTAKGITARDLGARATVFACAAIASFGLASGTLKAQEVSDQPGARVSLRASSRGLVYVETNNSTPGRNAVLAFSRDRFGRLKELPGSPFVTNGTGVRDLTFALGPFANDQPIIANRNTRCFSRSTRARTASPFSISAATAR